MVPLGFVAALRRQPHARFRVRLRYSGRTRLPYAIKKSRSRQLLQRAFHIVVGLAFTSRKLSLPSNYVTRLFQRNDYQLCRSL